MTFVVELMAFVIVLGVLWRYVIPPVQQAMNARQEMARKLVSDSEEAGRLLEKAQTAYKAAMADARHEAAQLRAQAEQQRREIVDGASTEAAAEAAEIISRGQTQVEAERRQAVRQLKTELGNLAVELAEKILGEALADNQRQERLIERFLSQIEEEANAASVLRKTPRDLSQPTADRSIHRPGNPAPAELPLTRFVRRRWRGSTAALRTGARDRASCGSGSSFSLLRDASCSAR
jgi:F-type H+-transporting ATPase subunit b